MSQPNPNRLYMPEVFGQPAKLAQMVALRKEGSPYEEIDREAKVSTSNVFRRVRAIVAMGEAGVGRCGYTAGELALAVRFRELWTQYGKRGRCMAPEPLSKEQLADAMAVLDGTWKPPPKRTNGAAGKVRVQRVRYDEDDGRVEA